MDIIKIANESGEFVEKHSPVIFLGAGIILGSITVTSSGNDVVRNIIEDPNLDRKGRCIEYAKNLIPLYIPVAIFGTGAVICLVKSYDISAKRLAAATALAEVSIESLRMYREKTRKILGKEKAKEIEQEVIKEQQQKDAIKREQGVSTPFSNDIHWYRESITNQEFLSTDINIVRANLDFSIEMGQDLLMSVNDWIDILNEYAFDFDNSAEGSTYKLSHKPDCDKKGWEYSCIPVVTCKKIEQRKDGQYVKILDYTYEPRLGFKNRVYGDFTSF